MKPAIVKVIIFIGFVSVSASGNSIISFIVNIYTSMLFPHTINTAISQGDEAGEGEFPYIVSVTYNDEHICGGFLYSNYFVLTAASCLIGYNLNYKSSNALFYYP